MATETFTNVLFQVRTTTELLMEFPSDDIIEQVDENVELTPEQIYERTLRANLLDYAPSICAKHRESLTLYVVHDDPYWSPKLEDAIRKEIEALKDPDGTPCELEVKDPATVDA